MSVQQNMHKCQKFLGGKLNYKSQIKTTRAGRRDSGTQSLLFCQFRNEDKGIKIYTFVHSIREGNWQIKYINENDY